MHIGQLDRNRIGDRLKEARKATGMSTRAIVALLDPRVKLSHATLANYEKGSSQPPIDLMASLATIYERPLNWFLGNGPTLSGVRYRHLKSKVGVRDRHQFEGRCLRWLEAYIAVETYLNEPLQPRAEFAVQPDETPAAAAGRMRKSLLKLGESDRVVSVVDVLELLGIRTMEVETDLSVDAMAAYLGEKYIVVTRGGLSNDRSRLGATHELGHIVLNHCKNGEAESKQQENEAFEFASHLLITKSMLKEAFSRKSVVDMVRFKERFGISLSALVYRAKAEKLITESEAKGLWIEFGKRGWRTKEPGFVWADRATRFEALIDNAIVQGRSNVAHLAMVAGVREEELKRRLALATGAESYDAEQEDRPADSHRLRLVQ